MTGAELREYTAEAGSTDVFGRVLCSARDHHFVIDGPVWNGCPGEALTPGEAFLAAVAACGVELVQAIAAGDERAIGKVGVEIHGVVDRDHPVRDELTVFNRVWLRFTIEGVGEEVAASLVERFGRRCPLFGSVAASAGEIDVEVRTV